MVSQAIIERQQDFFNHGEHAMQPMILQDIANELDMHESTISRATSGKFLLSTRGVYELKYFFSSALNTTDGNSSSSTAIRSLIKKMVNQESKSKPLSDNKNSATVRTTRAHCSQKNCRKISRKHANCPLKSTQIFDLRLTL